MERGLTDIEEYADIDKLNNALNPSENILLLIDEAHRSHSNTLHAYLSKALPNCAKIGFTGTPIISAKKKKTKDIFANDENSYIDIYSIRDSQKDKVTVPIFYEGLETMGAVKGANTLDQHFEVLFQDYTAEERAAIKSKYAGKKNVLNAKELMNDKARHILRHYVTRIMQGKFKAQVAASDRQACVLYQQYLTAAKEELIQELESNAVILQSLKLESAPPEYRTLVQAYPYLDTIKRLEFAAIISANSKKDPQAWKQWTDENNHTTYKNRFWKNLDEDGLAFLIVNNKLLVGFDAPLEQVLYVDRSLVEHDLLQAIARTNRTAEGKDYGLIVDYYGFELLRSHQQQGRDLFIQWYRGHLQQYLESIVTSITNRIGKEPTSIQVRELGNRWGSCNLKGDIYFHWRVALLPSSMIEYVIVHEMVHLIQPNHNRDFWDRVERILPDCVDRKEWLAKNGATFSL